MRYILILLAGLGVLASSLALREHYRTYGDSPCSINDKWDCGIVNHSRFAEIAHVPVAVIGIAGYTLLGVLALLRRNRTLLAASLIALAFALYLTRIEAYVLQVWCLYCVISQGIIALLTLLAIASVLLPKRPANV